MIRFRVQTQNWISTKRTEVTRTEKIFKEKGNLYFPLLNSLRIPLTLHEENLTIVYANPAFEDLTGLSVRELCGQAPPFSWWIQCNDADPAIPVGHETRQMGYLLHADHNKKLWIEILSNRLDIDAETSYACMIWVDVTKWKDLVRRISEQKRSLERVEARLRDISCELPVAREEERNVISNIIHNMLGYIVVVLGSQIAAIEDEIRVDNFAEVLKRVTECKNSLHELCADLRQLMVGLMPPIPETQSISKALEDYISEIDRNTHIRIQFRSRLDDEKIGNDVSTLIFRIVQESLAYAIKDSSPDFVDIDLSQSDQKIRLRVKDDGNPISFDRESIPMSHMGVTVIKKITEAHGGKFDIRSSREGGSEILVSIPFK
jgi:PAS domain S-box-containing protein